jgi:hypothetical protein
MRQIQWLPKDPAKWYQFCRMGAPWELSAETLIRKDGDMLFVILAHNDPFFVETNLFITAMYQCNSCLKIVGSGIHGLVNIQTTFTYSLLTTSTVPDLLFCKLLEPP